jgi:uncharacterized membrane protein (UPF0127 family)
MRRRHLIIALALLPVAARAQAEPTGPQPELPKQKLTIVSQGGARHDFDVEMALNEDQQVTGLMFRKSVPANSGMLFVWPHVQDSQMWMKNTLVPLDMVFINADGTIRHIAENTVPQSLAVIDSHGPVKATLELQGGITAKLGISVGDKVVGGPFGSATG